MPNLRIRAKRQAPVNQTALDIFRVLDIGQLDGTIPSRVVPLTNDSWVASQGPGLLEENIATWRIRTSPAQPFQACPKPPERTPFSVYIINSSGIVPGNFQLLKVKVCDGLHMYDAFHTSNNNVENNCCNGEP